MIARPRWRLRIAIGLLVLVVLASFVIGAVIAFQDAGSDIADLRSFDWLAITESAVNDLVFGGVALFFLLSIERRRKRTLALTALHRLRSFAHVIDLTVGLSRKIWQKITILHVTNGGLPPTPVTTAG